MLAVPDKTQNLGDRRIIGGQRLHRAQPFGKNTGTVKQLLIERPHLGEPLARELAALHADQVEAFETGVLAVDEAERDHVAPHAADAADHDLRPDPGELMHRGQPADINEVANLAMAAERGRTGKDRVIADHAVMADMAVVHEEATVANARQASALDGADIHRDAFPDRATGADFETCRFAAIAEIL